ncbi:potassium-transporting ATPase subunit KdpC [Tahibacter soli]|uniref:Potassium-transporting ATPase KdpC subunit n=1 Tax=Tahibacter soli TaxID=2983605 RepID=A0A9X3YQI1_9GAMM|nr:potassium-transporting ATPase subunit KdpC [Tahibacter soli]MDC8015605.1 potassium-transporting ATPase subunit KdpC [Tahibacter soli]
MNTIDNSTILDDRGGGYAPALIWCAVLVVFCGLFYPVVSTVLGGALFPHQATGSLIERDGRVVGSRLVAQPFADARYFQPRPSAAGYDPKAASGSNLASSNPALRERIAKDSAAVAARDGVAPLQIPSDLVTASGSGLDPDISPAAAHVQAARVAQARGLTYAHVEAAIKAHTRKPTLGVFGAARVNVLELNLALDASQGTK